MSPKTSESGGGKAAAKSDGGLTAPGRVTVLALVVISLVFIFENTRSTKVRLLISEVTMPLWMALLCMGAIGGLCGAYFMRRRG